MDVTFTKSWYDEVKEKTSAETLIAGGAAIVSQHADSKGAPTACEEHNVPNVAYNIDTSSIAPNTALISSKINWTPYFKYIIDAGMNGTKIDADWCGTIATGSVEVTTPNAKVATADAVKTIEDIKAKLASGEIKVYDLNKDNYITVDGKKLTSAMADIDDDGDFSHEKECAVDGVYMESHFRSAPSFDIDIDGIYLLNN